jgi:hypothetical protein
MIRIGSANLTDRDVGEEIVQPLAAMFDARSRSEITRTFSRVGAISVAPRAAYSRVPVSGLDRKRLSGTVAGRLAVHAESWPATATVANTRLIQVFGLGGSDNLSLVETNGALPRLANLDGGDGNDTPTGGSSKDLLIGGVGNDIFRFGAT